MKLDGNVFVVTEEQLSLSWGMFRGPGQETF